MERNFSKPGKMAAVSQSKWLKVKIFKNNIVSPKSQFSPFQGCNLASWTCRDNTKWRLLNQERDTKVVKVKQQRIRSLPQILRPQQWDIQTIKLIICMINRSKGRSQHQTMICSWSTFPVKPLEKKVLIIDQHSTKITTTASTRWYWWMWCATDFTLLENKSYHQISQSYSDNISVCC